MTSLRLNDSALRLFLPIARRQFAAIERQDGADFGYHHGVHFAPGLTAGAAGGLAQLRPRQTEDVLVGLKVLRLAQTAATLISTSVLPSSRRCSDSTSGRLVLANEVSKRALPTLSSSFAFGHFAAASAADSGDPARRAPSSLAEEIARWRRPSPAVTQLRYGRFSSNTISAASSGNGRANDSRIGRVIDRG